MRRCSYMLFFFCIEMSLSEEKTASRKHTVHFLSNPVKLKWPVVSTSEEEGIAEELHSIFDKYKGCLQAVRKPRHWQKNTSADPEKTVGPEKEQLRKTFKSWMVVGLQQVIKSLERDRLRLLLVARDLQPAVLKSTLLQLVYERGVPAVCVGGLHTTVVKSWTGLSSLAALGVLKTEVPNDFDSLVKFVNEFAAPVDKVPEMAAMSEDGHETANVVDDKDKEVKQTKDNDKLLRTEKKTVEKLISKVNASANVFPSTNDTASSEFDPCKYYVYKQETSKDFSGQSFIQFGEEDSAKVITEVIEIVNGRRQAAHTDDQEHACTKFGISPALVTMSGGQIRDMKFYKSESETNKTKKKRKHSDLNEHKKGKAYKAVNVQQRTEKSSKQKKNKKLKKK
ncbi:uncharacterized protein LOC128216865 [Mya arenaria]|uniref:uncharacterized protein LOC128216865 n=1 Tax=Mya arenaria TaxID=6604 RepID=UPI0022E09FE1|nr:uncharacterized protein LOC128216865 [Mya arenaria]